MPRHPITSTALALTLVAAGAAGSVLVPGLDAAAGALTTATTTAHRIAPPVAPPPGGGPHTFMMKEPGTSDPVTYNPCKRIRYAVNVARQPAKAKGLVASAIASVAKYTGLRFTYVGTTSRQPDPSGNASITPEPGKTYAPVLIAWTTPQRVPALKGAVAGEGGSTAVSSGGSSYLQYVTGQVSLDSADFVRILNEPKGYAIARAIVMHELGHVVGLDHVKDKRQIMYPTNVGQTAWGLGDRTGLALVGDGRCVA